MNIKTKIEKNQTLLLLIALSFATLIAYCNVYHNEFLWDDEFLIQENIYITSPSYIPKIFTGSSTAGFGGSDSFYRPTQLLYYNIIHSLFGLNPVGFHAGNILLHLLNTVLLFTIVLLLWGNRFLAFATALIWTVHPMHTEAITYMSGTADPMSVLFILLATLCYLKMENKKYLFLSLGLISYALALISKEAIIIFPGLLMIIEFMRQEKKWHWKNYLWTLPFWAMSFGFLILRDTLLNFDDTYSFYKTSNIYTENIHYRIFTFLAALPEYFKIFFWPQDLHMERHFPVFAGWKAVPVIFGGIMVLVGTIGLYFTHKKQKSFYTFAFLWFFCAFVPMSGILLPVNSFILEHWLYLPAMGLCVVVAALINKIPKKAISYGLLGVIALSLTLVTLDRNRDWKDPITFYNNILSYNDGSARVHNNLAMAYAGEEQFDKAIQHYNIAIEKSDTYPQTHHNLARVYIRLQRYDQAQAHLKRALELKPDFHHSIKLQKKLKNFLERMPASK